jgi:hypothetical protein
MVAILAVPLFLLAGLVADGGAAIAGRQRAANLAEEAARAGANAIDVSELRRGNTVVLRSKAQSFATTYLNGVPTSGAANMTGFSVRATTTDVTVDVTVTTPTIFLGLIGVNEFQVTGTATARFARGITGEGT